jgi:meiotically up-regulated gene 157 (Mug157) protein
MLGAFLDDLDDDDAARMDSDHLRQLEQLAFDAATVAKQIDEGIQKFGVAPHPTAGRIFAYEVDGFGSANFMDDANCPSLLSLPYLGYVQSSDPVYLATRSFVWSNRQGFWWSGSAGRGIGGPHAGYGMIWPMSMVMFALTSESDAEISWALDAILQSSAGTGLLHESFWINDVNQFTRPWFAWIDGLFGELVIKIAAERPHLIFKQ